VTPYVRGEPVIYLDGRPTHWLAIWQKELMNKKIKLTIDNKTVIIGTIWDFVGFCGIMNECTLKRFYDGEILKTSTGRFDLEILKDAT
jgi:hypothetical protein